MCSELSRPSVIFSSIALSGILEENDVVRNSQSQVNEVKLIEKIDDIAGSSINCCRFFKSATLATASA